MVRHPDKSGGKARPGQAQKSDARTPQRTERVAKALARAGVASRREIERLINLGKVAVNGRILDTPAVLVSREDILTVDGEVVNAPEAARLWRYHKPTGLVTTHKDPQDRPTVFENLPEGLPRVISVGRLDLNSEGLLLLTNDGGLARALELPSTGWRRVYRARALGQTTQDKLDRLMDGITVEGVRYGPIEARLDKAQGANVWITVSLSEGKNREVRRVLEAIGLRVNRLIRLAYGPFQLGTLEMGATEEVGPRVIREQLEGLIPPENMPTGDTVSGPVSRPGRRPTRTRPANALADPTRKPSRVRAVEAAAAAEEAARAQAGPPASSFDSPRPPRSGDRTGRRPSRGGEGGPKRPFDRTGPRQGERGKSFDGPRPPRGEGRSGDDRPRSSSPRPPRAYGGDRPREDRPRTDGPRTNRPRSDRPRTDAPRSDRPRDDRPRDDRPRGERPSGDGPRDDRPRSDRPRDDRPRSDGPRPERKGGDRPFSERPRSDRPRSDRPYGERERGQSGDGDKRSGRPPRAGGGFKRDDKGAPRSGGPRGEGGGFKPRTGGGGRAEGGGGAGRPGGKPGFNRGGAGRPGGKPGGKPGFGGGGGRPSGGGRPGGRPGGKPGGRKD